MGARRSASGWRAALRRTRGGALLLLLLGLVFTVGLAFVALGCVLIVAPGPLTIPPILLGLSIWSTEFRWADRQLDRAKASGPSGLGGREGPSSRVRARDERRARRSGVVVRLAGRYVVVTRAREVVGV